jgi:hypothetical protein
MTSDQPAAPEQTTTDDLTVDVPAGLLADTVNQAGQLTNAGTLAAQAAALTGLQDLMSQLITWHPHYNSEVGEILDEEELAERGVPDKVDVTLNDTVQVPADLLATVSWLFTDLERASTALAAAWTLIKFDEMIGDLMTYHPAYDLDRGCLVFADED